MQRFSETQGAHDRIPPRSGLYDFLGSQKSQPTFGSGSLVCRHDVGGATAAMSSHGAMMAASNNKYGYNHSFNKAPARSVMPTASSGLNPSLDYQPYFLDRGNGQFTQLIPADMLPPLNEIPAREASAVGKVVLQPISPKERRFTLKTGSQAPGTDKVQHRIDNIVSNTPSKPKRDKIYCDKWVHEGVCAFAQQGCRYKHEMPQDKETQHKLGLYQGLPAWWRKQQGETLQSESKGEPNTPPGSSQFSGAAFVPIGRRATVTHGVRSPASRPERTLNMRALPAVGDAHAARITPGASAAFPGPTGTEGCLSSNKPWTADPVMRKSEDYQGQIAGLDQCIWGPIEPPKTERMRSGRYVQD